MPYIKSENEKVAKMKRSIIDGGSRRFKNKVLSPLYDGNEAYVDTHYYILTDFQPGEEQKEMLDVLSLCFEAGIDISKSKAWKMYYRQKTTLFADKVNNLSDLAKIAFIEQEQKEDDLGDTSEWQFFEKVSS